MSYVFNHIWQNIPPEILQLAFKPRKYNTTVEQRIMSRVIDSILLDINLVGGRRREIIINSNWRLNVPTDDAYNIVGTGIEGSFYLIPPEAREDRNISSVIGISPFIGSSLPGTGLNANGQGSFGNTATGMLSQMLNTRTFGQYPIQPRVTLEGTNILCFYPELITEGVAVSIMLEYDSEFLNMNQSAIFAMRNLCLCAVQRYISTNLMVSIDESEVVAGMEIGVVKDIVNEYKQKAEQYQELLIKLKGALVYDPRALSKMIYYSL